MQLVFALTFTVLFPVSLNKPISPKKAPFSSTEIIVQLSVEIISTYPYLMMKNSFAISPALIIVSFFIYTFGYK